jgi:hypothetical protein
MKRSRNARLLQALLGVGLLFGLSGLSGWNIGMKQVEAFHIDKGEAFQTTLIFPYTTLSIALEADNDLPCPIAEAVMNDGSKQPVFFSNADDHIVTASVSSTYNPGQQTGYRGLHLKCFGRSTTTLKLLLGKPIK